MLRRILAEGTGGCNAVDLTCGELDDALSMLHAKFGDLQVLCEVQLEYINRITHIQAGIGHRHQIDDQVVINRQMFQFFLVPTYIEMDEADLFALPGFIQLLALDIERRDLVFPVVNQTLGKFHAKEPTGTQEKDLHEKLSITIVGRLASTLTIVGPLPSIKFFL